eukprot:5567709-Amphidinium_carterae.4
MERAGAAFSSLSLDRLRGTACLLHNCTSSSHAWSRSSCLPRATAPSSVRSFLAVCLQGSLGELGWGAAVAVAAGAVVDLPGVLPWRWRSLWPRSLATTERWHDTPWGGPDRVQRSLPTWT